MKLVLFDIDGTMITSRGAGRRAMRTALELVFGDAGGIDQYDLGGRTDTRIVHDVVGAMGWEPARVRERLDDFFEAYVADVDQLPPHCRAWAKQQGLHRAVADYVAGMTDRYAQDEYRKMFHPFENLL